MTPKIDITFGALPIRWTDGLTPQRGAGTLYLRWLDASPYLTLEVFEGEPLLVETGDFTLGNESFNARCGDSNHDYYFQIPHPIIDEFTQSK